MTDKYCPLRFREFGSQPHDQRCIGEYCAWFGKCSQSHGEPRTDTVETQTRVCTETDTETAQEPREADENANDEDTREKLADALGATDAIEWSQEQLENANPALVNALKEPDSREKLEADFADSLCLFAHYAHDHYERETVMQMVADRKSEFTAFLDRQATITRFQETSNQPNSGFVAQKQAETAENDTTKSEIRDFDDTREKLEAEILDAGCADEIDYDRIIGWLDRQAAITDAEWEDELEQLHMGYKPLIDELKEERDLWNKRYSQAYDYASDLQAQLDEAKAKPDCDCCEWQEENAKLRSQVEMLVSDGLLAAYLRHCERIDDLQEQLDKLSSDELHWRTQAQQADSVREARIAKLLEQRDEARAEADYYRSQYERMCKAVDDVARNYTVVDIDGEVVA